MDAKEQKLLDELVTRLRSALPEELEAVILYGSAAHDSEFHREYSDLNTLCLLTRNDAATLRRLAPVAAWWSGKGQPVPLALTFAELQESADVFAIELTDIKSRHRAIFGADRLQELAVPMQQHRLQLERELRVNLIRLRESYLAGGSDAKKLKKLMVTSVSSFVALLRHVLIAFGERVPPTRREVVAQVESLLHLDGSGISGILELRQGTRTPHGEELEGLFAAYVAALEAITREVDKRLA